jgi:hypothetical protein
VDDGPLRYYDDPENAEFLEVIPFTWYFWMIWSIPRIPSFLNKILFKNLCHRTLEALITFVIICIHKF